MTGKSSIRHRLDLKLTYLLSLLFAWVIVIFALSNRYLNTMLHPACPPAPKPPQDFREVSIPFQDQFLTGWQHPSENGAVILIFGGHGANQAALLNEAQFLADAGYGVLSINYRHCFGERLSFGWLEIDEFNAAFDYAKTNNPDAGLGVFGFSAGGITAMRGTAQHPEIKALAAAGNYVSLDEEISYGNAPTFSFRWQIERGICLLYWLKTGVNPKTVSSITTLENITPRPVLLIHGELEAERNQAVRQQQAAGPNAELWIVPNSGHGGYFISAPEQYAEVMINFFDRHLK